MEISNQQISRTFRLRFSDDNTMVCVVDDSIELLNVATMIKILFICHDSLSENVRSADFTGIRGRFEGKK